MEVPEASVARVDADHVVERAEPDPAVRLEMHLAVIGGDHEHRVLRARRGADEAVGRRELGGVERTVEPERVGHLVHAGVVRVDEGCTTSDLLATSSTSTAGVVAPRNSVPRGGRR